MDKFLIFLVLLLVSIFASRSILQKANKSLDQEKKAALVDLSTGKTTIAGWLFMVLNVLFLLNLKFKWIDSKISFGLYAVIFFVYSIYTSMNAQRKFKDNGFPKAYIQSYFTAAAIRILGVIVLISIFIFSA